jgi:CBS domain-containing protein
MGTDQIPTASELMEDVDLEFSPEMDLLDAVDELARHKASAAPVVDETQHLLGMLTEKDCIRILTGSAFYRPRGGKVEDFMSEVRIAIEPEMDLFRVSELFLGNNFPMLPVVDEGKLVWKRRPVRPWSGRAPSRSCRRSSPSTRSTSWCGGSVVAVKDESGPRRRLSRQLPRISTQPNLLRRTLV